MIIGGGPSGSLLAYILSKYQNYSVRIIETLPDLRNPAENYVDRSSSITLGILNIFLRFYILVLLTKINLIKIS